jgi:hypothetical protein
MRTGKLTGALPAAALAAVFAVGGPRPAAAQLLEMMLEHAATTAATHAAAQAAAHAAVQAAAHAAVHGAVNAAAHGAAHAGIDAAAKAAARGAIHGSREGAEHLSKGALRDAEEAARRAAQQANVDPGQNDSQFGNWGSGQEQTQPSGPPQRTAISDGLPKSIQLEEQAGFLHYSITLKRTGGNSYAGTWSHGYVSRFTVVGFTKDSMAMRRLDNPTLGSVSGSYVGSRSGNSAQGGADISNGFHTKWEASW